jgi:hypothetical protein
VCSNLVLSFLASHSRLPGRYPLPPSLVADRRLVSKSGTMAPMLKFGSTRYPIPIRENPKGQQGVPRKQTSATHKQEKPVPCSGGVGPEKKGILLPPHKAILPRAQGGLCKGWAPGRQWLGKGPTFTNSLPRPSQSSCRSSP